VLLLDEPTEGIQPSIIKDIARSLNEIRKMRALTIVVSEQVLSFTLEIADRFLVIDKGRFVYEDTRERRCAHHQQVSVGLIHRLFRGASPCDTETFQPAATPSAWPW
jgi:ABC-type branched-subunit amino acid transport system ATPase component